MTGAGRMQHKLLCRSIEGQMDDMPSQDLKTGTPERAGHWDVSVHGTRRPSEPAVLAFCQALSPSVRLELWASYFRLLPLLQSPLPAHQYNQALAPVSGLLTKQLITEPHWGVYGIFLTGL